MKRNLLDEFAQNQNSTKFEKEETNQWEERKKLNAPVRSFWYTMFIFIRNDAKHFVWYNYGYVTMDMGIVLRDRNVKQQCTTTVTMMTTSLQKFYKTKVTKTNKRQKKRSNNNLLRSFGSVHWNFVLKRWPQCRRQRKR